MLSDLNLQSEYRSDRCDLVQDFYIPCLENSIFYSRAVGFFSSTSMATMAKGLMSLLHSGGMMRLIASPCLSEQDAEAIALGLKQREEVITQSILRELDREFEEVLQDRLACLAWLVSKNILEIKLAVCKDIRNHQGIYHEKLGIFSDEVGNLVAFTGSANESSSALIDNFECIDVFCSWESGVRERTLSKAENFRRLWENQTPLLDILDFPEAAKRSLLRLRPDKFSMDKIIKRNAVMSETRQEYQSIAINRDLGMPVLPSNLELREYQKQAIANWFKNNGRGTLKMATGSGKTITALAIATELYQKIGLQVLLIVCPYRHLVIQWSRECQKFGLEPILAFENVHNWQDRLSNQLYNVRSGNQKFLTIITTNATLIGQGLQSQLRYLPEKTLIIGDEAHNLGAKRLVESLPRNVGLRLALSATPERYFDEDGTEAIFAYFGAVIQPEFTLADAIKVGALVHYLYYPILVELTDSETDKYADLTKKIGRAIAFDGDRADNEMVAALLMQRARLLGSAANKLVALRELMQQRLDTTHTLIYCGDGSVEDEVTTESNRQLDAVAHLLGSELGYRVNTYTAETSLDERENLRLWFETGELQGLVAIRCLDEGVDIPAIQTAIMLASSSNPRQFIQRRGRILRSYPDKKRATLFDMIVLPPDLGRETLDVERNLLKKELLRFIEFANLADNGGEARLKLLDLQQRYGLMDL
nr:DNA phosphorothioation system restriction enzyme [Pseudanabaena sp. 'Roaring Creek']